MYNDFMVKLHDKIVMFNHPKTRAGVRMYDAGAENTKTGGY